MPDRSLHLPAFREHYAAQAALATQESLSYPRFLLSLSEIEVKIQRQRRAIGSVNLGTLEDHLVCDWRL